MIEPDWPAPEGVQAFCSTREGGVSRPPFDSLNTARHVGDRPEDVDHNRALLPHYQHLVWLNQIHGNRVVDLTGDYAVRPDADASFVRGPGPGCVVMIADCLPVLLCDDRARVVAAIHGGWRGLAAGVIANTIDAMAVPANELMAWLGPAIGPQAFEVGDDVRASFGGYEDAFRPTAAPGKYLADLYTIARMQLRQLGVHRCFGGHHCTYSESERFFSFRRDGQTGRMACVIWLS